MPKISIITINYNNLDGLKRTIESVVNQTWKEFEYIVIDGGSTDGSFAYIESQTKDIDYWVSEPDKGIYNAMNKGIARAKGDYLIFLNSGDHFVDDKALAENNKFLEGKDIIYFNLQVVDKNKKFIKTYPEELPFSYFVKDTLPHPAAFIKATLFNTVGLYDENIKIVSDWKFFIESVCKFNCSYERINQTLSTFYLDGLSSDLENKLFIAEEKWKVLNSEFKAYNNDATHLFESNAVLANLRKSTKIKLLIRLGLLKRF